MTIGIRQRTVTNNDRQVEQQPQPSISQPTQLDSPRGLCSRLAYGVANCAIRIGIGAAFSNVWLPDLPFRDACPFDEVRAFAHKACPLQEFIHSVNLERNFLPHLTVLDFKINIFMEYCIASPIREEIMYRGLHQDVLFTRVPKWILKQIAPSKVHYLDSTTAKVIRIALTAFLFSLAHIGNFGSMSDDYVARQLFTTLVYGVVLGALKESRVGLLGCISSHVVNNLSAFAPFLWSC